MTSYKFTEKQLFDFLEEYANYDMDEGNKQTLRNLLKQYRMKVSNYPLK